ncbi:hypothetical protein [Peribacillus muralis]|uniref:hypothetical protein n=1 Tax=Peribacillus muralis TaxID=264697 RepID=UPI00070FD947|nr:hypothetical protein [Peribacillus muralis]MCK1994948.1 hypothetical protein [Peribacillus muralis]MCK2015506.1 hypothetical protein [Peribacillus muralis]
MFNGGTWFASEAVVILLTFLPIIFYLVLTVFGIYFVIKVIKFMNAKTKSDQERNEKIEELIKVVNQGKRTE